ncbi:MAG: polysaccharide deacetylase family protein [Candidatus Aminicenantes bacterium]|nr:polysaccharide deacetylase family protein [Candidatus Aminicenantes bacterium]
MSFDLDNLWSYMKTHGDPGWESYPSYLGRLIPDVLEFFDKRSLRVTFFVVGRDAARDVNVEPLQAVVAAGHEVGNHSFDHEPWLHRKTREEIASEIARAEEAIVQASGQKPRGFRGPGFSWNADLLDILDGRGYLYDASTFPTFIGPLGRLYYFAKSRLTERQKEDRKELFGGMAEGLRPVRPYRWQLGGGRTILEIPVTTMPLLKTPFHLSYLLYLGGISPALMRMYFRAALEACRLARTGVSFLLHPLDFLSGDDAPELAFFPAMATDRKKKRDLVSDVFSLLRDHFSIYSLNAYAERCLAAPALGDRGAR